MSGKHSMTDGTASNFHMDVEDQQNNFLRAGTIGVSERVELSSNLTTEEKKDPILTTEGKGSTFKSPIVVEVNELNGTDEESEDSLETDESSEDEQEEPLEVKKTEARQETAKEKEQPLKWTSEIATQDPFHFT